MTVMDLMQDMFESMFGMEAPGCNVEQTLMEKPLMIDLVLPYL